MNSIIDSSDRFQSFLNSTSTVLNEPDVDFSLLITRELEIFRNVGQKGKFLQLFTSDLRLIRGSMANIERVSSSSGLVVSRLRTSLGVDLVDKIKIQKIDIPSKKKPHYFLKSLVRTCFSRMCNRGEKSVSYETHSCEC